jgi:hypothetical protein
LFRSFGSTARAAIALTALLSIAPAVAAQTITDARRVEFAPSPDHSAVDANTGLQLVTNYTLDVYLAGGAVPVQTANLGKPAPETDGMIRADFVALLPTALTAGIIYEAIVNAIGPGGIGSTARSNTFAFSAPCPPTTPAISPTSRALTTAAAATGTVSVTVAAGCAWTAASNASWITITAGATGSGNGSVSYSAAANPDTTSRSGTLTIAGRTFTVTQAAGSCSFAISPTSQTMPGTGGTGTVTVTTGTGCTWSSTSSASWVTITSAASGSGSGSVRFTADANTTTLARTATLTIAGKSFVLTEPVATIPTAPSNLRVVKGG